MYVLRTLFNLSTCAYIISRLATVNFFLGVVGVVQVSRIVSYNMSVKGETPKDLAVEAKDSVVESAKGLKGDVIDAVKKA